MELEQQSGRACTILLQSWHQKEVSLLPKQLTLVWSGTFLLLLPPLSSKLRNTHAQPLSTQKGTHLLLKEVPGIEGAAASCCSHTQSNAGARRMQLLQEACQAGRFAAPQLYLRLWTCLWILCNQQQVKHALMLTDT